MIRDILILLSSSEHYNKSETIEIAKGRYAIPTGIKSLIKNIKRRLKWQS